MFVTCFMNISFANYVSLYRNSITEDMKKSIENEFASKISRNYGSVFLNGVRLHRCRNRQPYFAGQSAQGLFRLRRNLLTVRSLSRNLCCRNLSRDDREGLLWDSDRLPLPLRFLQPYSPLPICSVCSRRNFLSGHQEAHFFEQVHYLFRVFCGDVVAVRKGF